MPRSFVFLLLPLAACAAAPPAEKPIGMANPASVYCVEKGGTIVNSASALGQEGVCHLPDGRKVGEWELFNENHRAPTAAAAS